MNIFIKYFSNKKGFTLLEMIIVISLVGILLSTVFSILLVVVRQQARIYRIVETRRQGDSVFNFMKEHIVRANTIQDNNGNPVCDNAGETYTGSATGEDFILINDGVRYSFTLPDTSMLYSDIDGGIDTPLNSDNVVVSAFSISCKKSTNTASAIVQFAYTVTFYDPTPSTAEGTQTLNYIAKVKLR